jgi:AcrR family transcriptional regulator
MAQSSAQKTREDILDSAAAVILREGAGNLTLERVARQAGISKGGLLYHFGQKEQLVQALLERMVQSFEDERRAMENEETATSQGRRTRAFVRASVEGSWARKSGLKRNNREMFAALLAAVTSDPELLEPLRRRSRQWQAELENDGLPADRATVVRLAADGLWLAEMLGLTELPPARRKSVVREMLRLASETRSRSASAGAGA